jgi:SNF2 family DNA or RNA helicase
MPPITINRLQVQLDADQNLRRQLRDLEKSSLADIQDRIKKTEEGLATIRRKLGVAKVKYSAREIIDRIESGVKPILVGAWHHDVIDLLETEFDSAGLTSGVIDGRTAAGWRGSFVEAFNNGSLDVLVGQIGAMGVSLNLQGGSHICCIEEDFSPATMDQFFARCHRIGQKDHVHVDIFESDTKLDKAIRSIGQRKARGHNTLMRQADAS